MNKLITTIEFSESRKATVEVTGTKLTISGVTFEGFHEQDCCESVYADFNGVKYYKKQIEDLGEIEKIEVKSVEDCGFILFIYKHDSYESEREGVLINCYNCQNGYYNDELDLIIKDGDIDLGKFDLEKFRQDG